MRAAAVLAGVVLCVSQACADDYSKNNGHHDDKSKKKDDHDDYSKKKDHDDYFKKKDHDDYTSVEYVTLPHYRQPHVSYWFRVLGSSHSNYGKSYFHPTRRDEVWDYTSTGTIYVGRAGHAVHTGCIACTSKTSTCSVRGVWGFSGLVAVHDIDVLDHIVIKYNSWGSGDRHANKHERCSYNQEYDNGFRTTVCKLNLRKYASGKVHEVDCVGKRPSKHGSRHEFEVVKTTVQFAWKVADDKKKYKDEYDDDDKKDDGSSGELVLV